MSQQIQHKNPQTSISKQGYSVTKNSVSSDKIDEMKTDLTVKPLVIPGYGNDDVEPFVLYKENATKLYLPRFYGYDKFKAPLTDKIPAPITTNLSFARELRPYQHEIVDCYMKSANQCGGGIISVGCGRGKCLAPSTPVMMYDGTIRRADSIKPKMLLMGDDSTARRVVSITRGHDIMYRISYNTLDRDDYIVNAEHILSLQPYFEVSSYKFENGKRITYKKKIPFGQLQNIKVLDYISLSKQSKDMLGGICANVNFDPDLTKFDDAHIISPYNAGRIISFINSNSNFIKVFNQTYNSINTTNTNDNKLPDLYVKELMIIANDDIKIYQNLIKFIKDNHLCHILSDNYNQSLSLVDNEYIDDEYNLYIHIPKQYKITSLADRIEFILGFTEQLTYQFPSVAKYYDDNNTDSTDSTDSTDRGDLEYVNIQINHRQLYKDFLFIIRSTGSKYSISMPKVSPTGKFPEIPLITLHASNIANSIEHRIYPITVTEIGPGEYFGFEITGNRRFLLGDFTITHNTVMALYIAYALQVKTLVLVHKEFLANQWKERAAEFLPNCRIGTIQGKTADVANKDIVIGMIQSLSDPRKDADYEASIFDEFGLVITDECHHLAARQFSRALAKYSFKYTLGLSATPERADGLSRVFKWFLGDIVYKDTAIQKTAEEKALDHIPDAIVRVYKYQNKDKAYCEEKLNFKKKPNTTVMETRIGKCIKRNLFILSLLPALIEEGRKILILSSRLDHIHKMKKDIEAMEIPGSSVGLYLGGMKQSLLDESATKRILIATYVMAEEAFDCPALNTLIFATPKKIIIQAVGRIMRQKKSDRAFVPLVIDISDIFSNFKNWGLQRLKYYKKMSYDVDKFIVDDNISPRVITPDGRGKSKSGMILLNGCNNGDNNGNKYEDDEVGEIDDGEYDEDDMEIMAEEGRIEYII